MKRKQGFLYVVMIVLLSVGLIGATGADIALAEEGLSGAENSAVRETDVKQPKADDLLSSSTEENNPLLKDIPESEIKSVSEDGSASAGNDNLIRGELERIMLEFGEDDDLPQVFFDEVKGYIRLFQTNAQYRKFVTASLKRSAKYMSTVKGILSKRGIPEDMAYIAFIESGFNPKALSHAGALGMWQFMPGTGRDYALKVGRSIDERLDPVRSTYAAADYFHDLIAIFGPRSFLLAMAAYNSGEGRIIGCLKGI